MRGQNSGKREDRRNHKAEHRTIVYGLTRSRGRNGGGRHERPLSYLPARLTVVFKGFRIDHCQEVRQREQPLARRNRQLEIGAPRGAGQISTEKVFDLDPTKSGIQRWLEYCALYNLYRAAFARSLARSWRSTEHLPEKRGDVGGGFGPVGEHAADAAPGDRPSHREFGARREQSDSGSIRAVQQVANRTVCRHQRREVFRRAPVRLLPRQRDL